MKVIIIGAGAAGCFCAIALKRRKPQTEVLILEAGRRPLAKVALTGGGRCNLTNSFEGVASLADVYPRGAQLMKRALRTFSGADLMKWFEGEGVRLVTQPDGRVFPASGDAMQVVRTLERLMREAGVVVECGRKAQSIKAIRTEDASHSPMRYEVFLADGSYIGCDKVVVTTGGGSTEFLRKLLPEDIEITETVPSLFTFKVDDAALRELTGTVAEKTILSLAGTKFRSTGPLLVTDWGLSGPATLRLSSYAARHLAEIGYKALLLVNWTASSEVELRQSISAIIDANPFKQVASVHPEGLSDRLWRYLAGRAGLRADIRWAELGSKGINKLVSTLSTDCYEIAGRAKFKEEFVTCGGVALSAVNLSTLESKSYPGLFFAGEVLDEDAVTGGFNLQAAWSTGKVVAESI